MPIELKTCLAVAGLVLWLPGILCWAQPSKPSIKLTDVTAESGISFQHTDGAYGQFFLIESMSAGLALLDYDLDGDLDIYFLNGARISKEENRAGVLETSQSSVPNLNSDAPLPRNALYRNDGGFRFVDVTLPAGVGDTQMGLGVAVADYDNDGWPDIYVNNYGANVLYSNNGDGTFSDCTRQAGVGNGFLVGGGAAFLDPDDDGDLDLYVGNYIQFDPAEHQVHVHKGLPSYPSPLSFDPEPDTFFENNGDGTFTDVSDRSGIRQAAGRSMGLLAFDYDQDGDIDVYVANDTQENYLFENDGRGNFEEVALLAGLALDFKGKSQASMGVELADLDRDGLQDLVVTSFSEEFVTLYQNLGSGFFDDVTLRKPAFAATLPHVTWGIVGGDFDNNGFPDLLIGAGDLDVNRGVRGGASQATAYRIPNLLLANTSGEWSDLESNWGNAARSSESTRGLIAADLDQDGWLDAVMLNAQAQPSILKNESAMHTSTRSFVHVHLCGTISNRDGLGAKVSVTQGDLRQTEEKHSGHGYQSDLAAPLHFGLPSKSNSVQVHVLWPTGRQAQLTVQPGESVLVIER